MSFSLTSKKNLLAILTVVAITLLISSAISIWISNVSNIEIPTMGTVKTIGVEAYWDENLENKTNAVDWGIIWPGSTKNVTFYLQSKSNVKIKLLLNTTNWNPPNISQYMNLSWNYNGTPIHPSEVVRVTINLSTHSSSSFIKYLIINDMKDFNFDLVIYATE